MVLLKRMDYLEGPDENLFKKIQEELKEDSDRFNNNLKILEEWMNYQPHLPKNYDRKMLPIYLRGCKHDMEKAKRKLELYFVLKKTIPEIYYKMDPCDEDIARTLEISFVVIMPKLSPEGYRITYNGLTSSDMKDFIPVQLLKRGSFIAEVRSVFETPIAGDILVYDVNNITASHASIFLSPIIRRAILEGPEMYPNRLRQIHLLNVPSYFEKILGIIKTMIKAKMRERFHVHSDPKNLKNYLPDYCIPSDYGGSAHTLKEMNQKTNEFIKSHRDWFLEQHNVNLVGPIPEKYNYVDNYGTGTEGSFRKLAID